LKRRENGKGDSSENTLLWRKRLKKKGQPVGEGRSIRVKANYANTSSSIKKKRKCVVKK